MCDEIRHRGPEDEGYRIDGRMGLGMRRLGIIDLATGRQPISNEDGTIWVVSNGEIYNYRELRASLIRSGHRFRTYSDTEVLVHLYEEEGVDGIQRLRGMFACAIWDSQRRSLLLARDRFGKKPLYIADYDGLYFGSELKCLRAAGVPLEHDREALQLYFLLGYVPDPWTPYVGIRKLPPGAGCAVTRTAASKRAAIGLCLRRPRGPPVSANWRLVSMCEIALTKPSKCAWSRMCPWGPF
jgi:asparagine synthase (glutamine-hydrolysing)